MFSITPINRCPICNQQDCAGYAQTFRVCKACQAKMFYQWTITYDGPDRGYTIMLESCYPRPDGSTSAVELRREWVCTTRYGIAMQAARRLAREMRLTLPPRAGINYYNNWTGSKRRHDDFPATQKSPLDLLIESRVEEDARQRAEAPANVDATDPAWLPFDIAQVTAEAERLRAENEAREAQHDAEIAAIGALFNAPVAAPEPQPEPSFSAQYLAFAVNAEQRLALEEPPVDPWPAPEREYRFRADDSIYFRSICLDIEYGVVVGEIGHDCKFAIKCALGQGDDDPDWCWFIVDSAGLRTADDEPYPTLEMALAAARQYIREHLPHLLPPPPLSHDAQAVLGFAQELIRAVEARAALNAHQQQAFMELYSLSVAYDKWAAEKDGGEPSETPAVEAPDTHDYSEDYSGCAGNSNGDHDLFYSETQNCTICGWCGETF